MKAAVNLVKAVEPVAKKQLGQHFLKDTGVLERIARWIAPAPEQFFLEIGAGAGALSVRLAAKAGGLAAIELDSDCLPVLEEALAPFHSAVVIPGDILHLNLVELVAARMRPEQTLRVAGNLPYNIGTVIIDRLLHSGLPVTAMFFMLQLEVAQRIAARPDSGEYGYLSVLCQHRAQVSMGFKVAPACFAPRPKVMSATIALYPHARFGESAFGAGAAAEADFEELVKACFAHRRKTVLNSLSRHPRFGPGAAALLSAAAIDGTRRAENITVAEYEHLAAVYRQINHCG